MFSTVLLMAALWMLAVPGSSAFVSELYVLIGAFRQNAWLGVVAACAIVLAAMYALRWLAGIAYQEEGDAVAKDTPDLRIGELGIAVPLLLILLVMTAWPMGVMERIGL
jgi:NADH:ubiquinone oxidoreductase subunit 4 (subunit M)